MTVLVYIIYGTVGEDNVLLNVQLRNTASYELVTGVSVKSKHR